MTAQNAEYVRLREHRDYWMKQYGEADLEMVEWRIVADALAQVLREFYDDEPDDGSLYLRAADALRRWERMLQDNTGGAQSG